MSDLSGRSRRNPTARGVNGARNTCARVPTILAAMVLSIRSLAGGLQGSNPCPDCASSVVGVAADNSKTGLDGKLCSSPPDSGLHQ